MEFRMKKIVLSLAAGAVFGVAPTLASAATEVNWGGDIIIRPFYRDGARDFDKNVNDAKKFTTERTRLKANIKVEEDIGGVVELLHFRKWGASDPNRNVDANATTGTVCTTTAAGVGTPAAATYTTACSNPALDDNWMDLNQAYIEVKHLWDTPAYLRVGRQELAYGDQRLVGNTNFWSTYPFPRAYDAAKVGYKSDTLDVDAWHGTVTERQFAGLFGAPANSTTAKPNDRMFNGIWATVKMIPDNIIDVYYLNMDDAGYLINGPVGGAATGCNLSQYEGTGLAPNFGHLPYASNANTVSCDSTKVYNVGARVKGKYAGLDYTVELNQQFGHAADGASISATGGAAVVGYTIPEAMGLRVSGEFVYASGDDSPTTGDHKTFYQFTPSPHMHLGAQDFIAFQNINAWRIGASFNARKNLKLSLDFWDFKLDKQQDLWYSSNLTSTRGAIAAIAARGGEALLADKKIGTEIDLVMNYLYSGPLSFELGYSQFNPGNGIKGASAGAGGINAVNNGITTNLVGHTVNRSDVATFAWGMLMLKF